MRLVAFIVGFAGGMIVQLAMISAANYLIDRVVPPMVVPQGEIPEDKSPEEKVEPETYLPKLEWQYYGPRPQWVERLWDSRCGCNCGRVE